MKAIIILLATMCIIEHARSDSVTDKIEDFVKHSSRELEKTRTQKAMDALEEFVTTFSNPCHVKNEFKTYRAPGSDPVRLMGDEPERIRFREFMMRSANELCEKTKLIKTCPTCPTCEPESLLARFLGLVWGACYLFFIYKLVGFWFHR